jgi:hypothetical protein
VCDRDIAQPRTQRSTPLYPAREQETSKETNVSPAYDILNDVLCLHMFGFTSYCLLLCIHRPHLKQPDGDAHLSLGKSLCPIKGADFMIFL